MSELTDRGLVTEGVEASVTYRTTSKTEKTITADVEELTELGTARYSFKLTVKDGNEEKERKIVVADRTVSVKAYDRHVTGNWRTIGRAKYDDVFFDLKLGGWVQYVGDSFRWYNVDSDVEAQRMYIVEPLDTETYQIVVDDEVVDVTELNSLEEAVDVAESLMNFKY